MADGAVAFGELGSGNIGGEKGVTEEGAVAAASISFLRRGGHFFLVYCKIWIRGDIGLLDLKL